MGVRKLEIEVVTRSLESLDTPPQRKVINFLNPSDRKWLSSHAWWAMHNNHTVTTAPIQH